MFGTIRPHDTLTCEQRASYRTALCTSCHALRELAGRPASLLTNYDQAALALVAAALEGTTASPVAARCTALPFLWVPVHELSGRAVAVLAAGNILAVDGKLADDIADERRLLSRTARRLLRGTTRRARAELLGLGFPVSLFDELLAKQQAAEAAANPTFASLAAASAEIAGQLFAWLARDPRSACAADLRAFGEALGRCVYVLDALRDVAEDRRKRTFNAVDRAQGGRTAAAAAFRAALTDARAALARLPLGSTASTVGGLLQGLEAQLVAVLRQTPWSRETGTADWLAACCCEAVCSSAFHACRCYECHCITLLRPDAMNRKPRPLYERLRNRRETRERPSPLVGATGIATTDIAPRGRVRIGALEYDAFSPVARIRAGDAVAVVGRTRAGLSVVRAGEDAAEPPAPEA